MSKVCTDMSEAAGALEGRVRALEQNSGPGSSLTRRLLSEGTDYTVTSGWDASTRDVPAQDVALGIYVSRQIGVMGAGGSISGTMECSLTGAETVLPRTFQGLIPETIALNFAGATATLTGASVASDWKSATINFTIQSAGVAITAQFEMRFKKNGLLEVQYYFAAGTTVMVNVSGITASVAAHAEVENSYSAAITFAQSFCELDSLRMKVINRLQLAENVTLPVETWTELHKIGPERLDTVITLRLGSLTLQVPVSFSVEWDGETLYLTVLPDESSSSGGSGSGSSGGATVLPIVETLIPIIVKTEVLRA